MKYFCPYKDCDGEIEYEGGHNTCAGSIDFDTNTFTEVWHCDTCNKKVVRSWEWKETGTNEG